MKFRANLVGMLMGLSAFSVVGSESGPPFLLDASKLEAAVISRQLDKALAAPIVSVTDKPKPSPTGDEHDYVSYRRYWWPDPESSDGLPFIRRDGHSNREQVALGDRGELESFIKNVSVLAAAWHLDQRADGAKRAGEWLRAWFVDPETRMNPNLEYAQICLGHDDDKGSGYGILDARGFTKVIDSIGLLEDSPGLSAQDDEAIRKWFRDYAHWLITSKNGRAARSAPNNHGTWYRVQVIAISRFLGDEDLARELAQEAHALLGKQFAKDGSQPHEIARATGLEYSCFNLEAMFQLATLSAPLGIDLWNDVAPNGASLRLGLDYLRPFNSAPDRWPHRQTKPMKPGFLEPLMEQGRLGWSASESSTGE
ncbi:alginate lyase family protein [Haloferula chungangensis]|uniref:Alginate lyase family protein n=1 Tax=Haloferula chungangensis TaxID=1048331 RepID=A0ABW2L8N7_9BACT